MEGCAVFWNGTSHNTNFRMQKKNYVRIYVSHITYILDTAICCILFFLIKLISAELFSANVSRQLENSQLDTRQSLPVLSLYVENSYELCYVRPCELCRSRYGARAGAN